MVFLMRSYVNPTMRGFREALVELLDMSKTLLQTWELGTEKTFLLLLWYRSDRGVVVIEA